LLVIPRRLLDQVVLHSKETFPLEACGLLAGRTEGMRREVQALRTAKNALNSPSRYQLDPEEQLRLFLEIEGEGREVVGVYHSHPYWSADPSEVDRAMAHYREFSYLIYSVPKDEFKSFSYLGGQLGLEEISIIKEGPSGYQGPRISGGS